MVSKRKTLKRSKGHSASIKENKSKGILTIPELRRSFEHIEHFMNSELKSHKPKTDIVKNLKKEWHRVFLKTLDDKTAETYVEHIVNTKNRRKTLKKHKGGMAPLDYTTRPGIYTQPAAIPPNAYGNILDYVSKGFWNPQPAQSYDPLPEQTRFPTSTPVGMGDNTVGKQSGGNKDNKRSNTRKLRRSTGGMASVPSSIIQDMNDMWKGREVNMSPDQIQRNINK